MQPLDALCELIDNSLDAFRAAKFGGNPIDHPLVVIELPQRSEVRDGQGIIRIRDNGPGLSPEMAESALRAGYSTHNPYDTLGLFGMGFNIATGKLGQVTRFTTARLEDAEAISAVIDLPQLCDKRTYEVPVEPKAKPQGLENGTVVEISRWWPEGNPNVGFIRKLVDLGKPKIREFLGRRYASILRRNEVRMLVETEPVVPFEHCHWSDHRFVTRSEHGQIPAVIRFDKVIGVQKRCSSCWALIPPTESGCDCGSEAFRTIDERIAGWVGIQRYDDETHYGIDLIRNGRGIRILEKTAFFYFEDEVKNAIKDYPNDSQYGRIIGEIHLDHVPVDFLKQDFQRASPEWQRAMSFLRGDTSLQPSKMNEGEPNLSPVSRLYQGYRRVRRCGRTDMYMGYWDAAAGGGEGGPKRISREIEKEFLRKFEERLPGYYDDAEWWKKVEEADTPPIVGLVNCPHCDAQNLEGTEVCTACSQVLISKKCIGPDCEADLPMSAEMCPVCGAEQKAPVEEPWRCQVCGRQNDPAMAVCTACGEQQGTLSPLSSEYLTANSNLDDDLSIKACSVQLADGSQSWPIDVNTYVTTVPLRAPGTKEHLPLVAFRGQQIDVFVHKEHPLFRSYKVRLEQMVAGEVAHYLFETHRTLAGSYKEHTLASLEWLVLKMRWADTFERGPEQLAAEIRVLFSLIRERLPAVLSDIAPDAYDNLDDTQVRSLVEEVLSQGGDVTALAEMRKSGAYLDYATENLIVDIFRRYPDRFFDGAVFSEGYPNEGPLSQDLLELAQRRTVETYLRCLEDLARYIHLRDPSPVETDRSLSALDFVQRKVT